MKTEEWKLADIKPYFRNSKKHNVDHIKESIGAFKVDQPIVVDSDGVIIKGHGRLKAAKQLKMKTFPVVVRTDLTPEQAKLSRLADNKSSEGGWDIPMLEFELNSIDKDSFADFDFSMFDIEEEPEPKEAEAPEEFKEYDEDIETAYCCPKCKYAWSGKPK